MDPQEIKQVVNTQQMYMLNPYLINRQSVVADDLTHNLTASLTKEELSAYLEGCMVEVPPPVDGKPHRGQDVGKKMCTLGHSHLPKPSCQPLVLVTTVQSQLSLELNKDT